MRELTYISPQGELWDLTPGSGDDRVTLLDGGIEGFVGATEPQSVSVFGGAGQRVTHHNVVEMGGTLSVLLRAPAGEDLARLEQRWRLAWSHHAAGTLSLTGHTLGRLSAKVRLHETPAAPVRQPGVLAASRVSVSGVVDDGLWWSDVVKGTGSVTVTNPGVVEIKPKIRWVGSGGRVVMPSGASFTLPTVGSARTLILDNDESCVVTDDRGRVDRSLWHALAPTVLPESVPIGERRRFSVPTGAELQWQVAVLDPWG